MHKYFNSLLKKKNPFYVWLLWKITTGQIAAPIIFHFEDFDTHQSPW